MNRKIPLAVILTIGACKAPYKQQSSQTESVVPVSVATEGVTIPMSVATLATIADEVQTNFGLLASALNPKGLTTNIPIVPITVRCQAIGPDESHCRLAYNGPEIKLKLFSSLFGAMSGEVNVAKGCHSKDCQAKSFAVWWRATRHTPRSEYHP